MIDNMLLRSWRTPRVSSGTSRLHPGQKIERPLDTVSPFGQVVLVFIVMYIAPMGATSMETEHFIR